LLALPFSTGAVPFWEDGLVTFAVPARDPAAAPLPALATEAFLAATGAQVGDEVTARLAGDLRTFTLTGVVRAFPTLDPAAPGLLVDLSTLATLEADSGAAVPEPGEWWVGVADGRAEAAAAALRAPPLSSREVLDRQERARAQSTNPVALGVLGILLLGFVAAAGFAVIGVAVSTVSSVRERVAEFCVVRALGLPPGQVRSWLVLESGLVLVASLVGGTALGLLLARLVLPSVTLTPEGAQVAPPVVVDVPVGPAVVLGLVLAAALVGVVAVQVALLRRVALAAVLRSGEER
jgi:predicted lysophospholipase L1 biosynthesis ABC-type transport system permease subunit